MKGFGKALLALLFVVFVAAGGIYLLERQKSVQSGADTAHALND